MLRPATAWVKAIAVVLAIAGGGCFWRSYAPRLRTHSELMMAMARKGVDLVRGDRLTAENMPELTYPLERAEAFARSAHLRAGDAPPPSLAAFDTLIARYRALIDASTARGARSAASRRRRHSRRRSRRSRPPGVPSWMRSAPSIARRAPPQARGISTTRLSSFTVASIVDTV